MKKKDETKKMEEEPETSQAHDQECRWQRPAAAQDHLANGLERRSADFDKRRRRRHADGQMRRKENVGRT